MIHLPNNFYPFLLKMPAVSFSAADRIVSLLAAALTQKLQLRALNLEKAHHKIFTLAAE